MATEMNDYLSKNTTTFEYLTKALVKEKNARVALAAEVAGKQNKISGVQGQYVGFDESGNPIATNLGSTLPEGGEVGQVLTKTEEGFDWTTPAAGGVSTEVVTSLVSTMVQSHNSENVAHSTLFNAKQDKLPAGSANQYLKIDTDGNFVWDSLASLHTHKTEGNFSYTQNLFGCSSTNKAYTSFTEMTVGTDEDEFTCVDMGYSNLCITTANGKAFLQPVSSNFDTQVDDISGDIANISKCVTSGASLAIIAEGKLYTREITASTTASVAGNMRGDAEVANSTNVWTQVGTDSDWVDIEGDSSQWLLLKASATGGNRLFTAGRNVCGLQATAGLDENGDPIFDNVLDTTVDKTNAILGGKCYLVTSPTEIKIEEDGILVTKEDWLQIAPGQYHSLALRGTNGKGTIYAWGCNHVGQLGNGVSYVHDMTRLYAWENGNTVVYTTVAPSKMTVTTSAYTDATTQTATNAITAVDKTAETITIDGVVYTYNVEKDVWPYKVGQSIPVPLALEDGTVYNDWEKVTAGTYHSGALRHNSNGESEVYLWGSNEYGCLGNGNYYEKSLAGGSLADGSRQEVELVAWPRKVTAADGFPYTDVVDVSCNHYGTFLYRANGEVYFAGCNKRNFLGTGVFSDATSFIPRFMKLSGFFTGNKVYAHTYGSVVVKQDMHLRDDADIAVKAVLYDKFAPEALNKAIEAVHNHAIDTNVIDQAAIMVNQFGDKLGSIAFNSHAHTNLDSLSQITIRNNVLFINGQMYSSGSGNGGNGGSGVYVDMSNLQLDNLTDMSGLCNLAGGMGLDIMSYRAVSDTKAVVRIAPLGTLVQKSDRYVSLYDSTGSTELITADDQAKGLVVSYNNSTSNIKLLNCSKDIVDFVSKNTASSGTFYFYYIDAASTQAAWINASNLAFSLSYSQLKTMTFKLPDTSEVLSTDKLDSVGVSALYTEENPFETIYDKNGEVLIEKETFESTPYYYDSGDGTAVVLTDIGVLANAITVDDEGNAVYPTLYDNIALTGTAVLTSAQISDGIYVKNGSQLMTVRPFMTPEKFNEALIAQNNTIYIHPCRGCYVGMANQAYKYDNAQYILSATADSDGTYPVESVILSLTSKVTTYENTTTEETFHPGSCSDPMVGSIRSNNRYATSSVSGEFNAAVGKNSTVSGNTNVAAGNFSDASGLNNVVTGDNSTATGVGNVVTGVRSTAHGSQNIVAGDTNTVVGMANKVHGYYEIVNGTGNKTFGIDSFVYGSMNQISGNRSTVIGNNNKILNDANQVYVVGNNNSVTGKDVIVLGKYGNITEYDGSFPTKEVRESVNGYDTTTYDSEGLHNKHSLHITAGDKDNPLAVLSYTKYKWVPNDAYFELTAASRKSSSLDPMLLEVDHRLTVRAKIYQKFAIDEEQTQFRNAGRIISCDPGLIVNTATDGLISINFNDGYKFKVKTSGTIYLENWVDGCEGYIAVYGGTSVTFPAEWVMEDDVVSPGSDETSFVLYKIIVIDDVVICKKVAQKVA